jgi:hypothetical protein
MGRSHTPGGKHSSRNKLSTIHVPSFILLKSCLKITANTLSRRTARFVLGEQPPFRSRGFTNRLPVWDGELNTSPFPILLLQLPETKIGAATLGPPQ